MALRFFPLVFVLACIPKKQEVHELKIESEKVLMDLDDLDLEDLPEAGEDTGK